MSNINQVIEDYYGNAWDCGDALICLKLAHELSDPAEARKAAARCFDVARRLERRQRKDPAHQPAPETVVCQDWHNAVREIRTGTPSCGLSVGIASPMFTKSVSGTSSESPENRGAVIAPTPSTPGWLDKAAESLPDKSKPTIRTNGVAFAKHVGDRWQHWCGPTLGWCTAPEWCANAAPRWEVATDEQLKDAGCASN